MQRGFGGFDDAPQPARGDRGDVDNDDDHMQRLQYIQHMQNFIQAQQTMGQRVVRPLIVGNDGLGDDLQMNTVLGGGSMMGSMMSGGPNGSSSSPSALSNTSPDEFSMVGLTAAQKRKLKADMKAATPGAINAARARTRINVGFKELAELCRCHSQKKPTILASAIERIKELKSEIARLKEEQDMGQQEGVSEAGVPMQERAALRLPMSPENVSTANLIRTLAQRSRIPGGEASRYDWTEEYQLAFDRGVLCMLVNGRGTYIQQINGALLKLLGYTREEVLGARANLGPGEEFEDESEAEGKEPMTILQLTHRVSVSDTLAVLAGLFQRPHSLHRYKKQYVHKDGSLIMALTTSWLSFKGDGEPFWVHTVVEPDLFGY